MSGQVRHDGDEGLEISFDYDPDLVDLVKGGLRTRKWDRAERVWRVPAADVAAVVELLGPEGFEFDSVVQGLFDAQASDDYTVGRLNREAHRALKRAFPRPIWLVGELSGYDREVARKGEGRPLLFSITERDADGEPAARLRCRLSGWKREHLERRVESTTTPFSLRDEVSVRLRVRVDMYTRTGDFQVDIEDIDPAWTLGEAARRREEVLRRLASAGLLERNARLPLAPLPLRVGIITSLDSDACADVLRTLEESGYGFDVTLHGARMQGRSTEASVLNALAHLTGLQPALDAIVIARGGGSRTDLAWFDSEPLGRAVAGCPVPVLVGIGHEQDQSVLDAVARSAKTPTAAASLLVEQVMAALDRVERHGEDIVRRAGVLLEAARDSSARHGRGVARATRLLLASARQAVASDERRLTRAAGVHLSAERSRQAALAPRVARATERQLDLARERLAAAPVRLVRGVATHLERETERTESRSRRLYVADPARVVERGFAILRGPKGRALRHPDEAPSDTRVTAQLAGGQLSLRSEGAAGAGGSPDTATTAPKTPPGDHPEES